MLPLLATLSPNAAILFLTIGVALIALELNRPGSIVPGAAGLFLTLLATASLIARHPRPLSALGVVVCSGLLFVQTRRHLSWFIPAIATILLIVSIAMLLPPIPGPEILGWVAASSGLFLGGGITVLTRIALRARQNKGLD
jgi:membrane-bound serine protease (ClpP class)